MSYFLQGALAGYGIAIPVGAIAVLIFETGLRRGFRAGFAAGAGAAAADTLYASLAIIAGEALSTILFPHSDAIKLVGGVILLGIGAYGIWMTVRASREVPGSKSMEPVEERNIFFQFLALTIFNPLTIVYFSIIILGGGVDDITRPIEGLVFVAGAALASLSWQTLLAGIGAFAHERMTPRFKMVASLFGYFVVIGFGLRILFVRS
jgi:arginine exporter protein ArgO